MATDPSPSKVSPSSFTEELKVAAGEQWDRVVHHRFTEELAAGTLDRDVLLKYLIQDHRFLDSFLVLLASIIAKLHGLADRLPACQFLGLVSGPENTYFERCFEKYQVTEEQRLAIPDAACTTGFCGLMREVAALDGPSALGEMLSVFCVCEWSYLSWGERVKAKTVREDFSCYEWVDLHSGQDFIAVVRHFRSLLDKEAADYLDDDGKAKCRERFLQAVQLEEDFFEFCYKKESS